MKTTHSKRHWLTLPLLAILIAACTLVTGCEDDDDDDYDHVPPAGLGSMLIDNRLSTDLHVYLDGSVQIDAREDAETAYDLDPGTYRVVLDEEDGDGNFADDIDILEGRVTILVVRPASGTELSVDVSFD